MILDEGLPTTTTVEELRLKADLLTLRGLVDEGRLLHALLDGYWTAENQEEMSELRGELKFANTELRENMLTKERLMRSINALRGLASNPPEGFAEKVLALADELETAVEDVN